jgi:hypothetical protein
MVYKFDNKSRMEVEEMLGITLQETRVYREIKEEALLQKILCLLGASQYSHEPYRNAIALFLQPH